MTRSKYSKQSKNAAWLQYAIQPSLPASESKASKPVALHPNLQLEAFLRPSSHSHFQLAVAFYNSGHMAEAIASYQQALICEPNLAEAHYNLAIAFEAVGNFEEAHQSYKKVLEINTFQVDSAFGNMVALQHAQYPIDMPREMEILRLYSQRFESFEVPFLDELRKYQLHKPLRIGFVSSDLRQHPVGYFLEGTLEQLKLAPELSDSLEFVAYYNNNLQDEFTFRLSEYFDSWYRVDGWSNERLVDQIKRDRVDILIDLSGHTRGSRLPVFTKKVAPLQVSWLGYWASTGLATVDYVLADPISIPKDEEKWFSEKIWRLPHLRYCFSIPEDAPDVTPSPCINKKQLVFGCYQMLHKINPSVLACWQRIQKSCPDTRIRIQSTDLEKVDVKKQLFDSMKALEFDMSRVDLIGFMKRKEYLASYAEVDILLDTFPFPGGTTTAEALWMGVPTISFALPKMLSRQGEALLVNAGLPEWVAYSEEEYVQKAIDWANIEQREKLIALRVGMRERVRHSPVFNTKQFAQDFVDAMYGMWEVKCRVRPEDALLNSALASIAGGGMEDAFETYQKVIASNASPEHVADAFSNMITLNLFQYPFDVNRQMKILKSYREHYESQVGLVKHAQQLKGVLQRPLKVGFISGDFRNHPISFFLESTLKQLKSDPKLADQLELFAYYNYNKQDEYTLRLKKIFNSWHYVDNWDDDELAGQITRDNIDVLIDLSGHTEQHRLPVFTRKIAPLQVSWLGYWGTTGLSSIDYVLADPITIQAKDDEYFSEKIWKLPHLRYCFSIPDDAPEVSSLPCLHRKQVVFGCYQRMSKLNSSVLGCWSRIMKASSDARLRIQMPDLDDSEVKDNFILVLKQFGFDITRIDLFGKTSRKEYLASYAEVDILLDTFHFPGGTTTAEALWMGVPTISLSLPGMLGRQGEAILTNAGLAGWVVYSEEEYVQEAIAWANADESYREALAKLRQGLREKVKNSPLFNAEQFASEFVDAIHGMWNEKYPESVELIDS